MKEKRRERKKDMKVKKEDKGSSYATKESRGQAKPLASLKAIFRIFGSFKANIRVKCNRLSDFL